ncbi:MAG: hypothetical protein FJZ58_00670 [Chlamydiae bacterium]|nr:hypothetical protein [Chlamydiota bacterium]
MLKKELKAALALVGTMVPLSVQADQAMANSKPAPSYNSGEMVRDGQLPAGYNQSASYNVDGWDVYFTADFIYWHLNEDMKMSGTMVETTSSGAASIVNGSGTPVGFSPTYKPGFQVGMGFNMNGMDNWTLYGEYTWYQNETSLSASSGSGEVLALEQGLLLPRVVTAGSMSGDFWFHYNCGDLSLQRPFYWGKKLTSNFGCGLRGLWISQNQNVTASSLRYVSGQNLVSESGSLATSFEQKSWALGPRFTLDTNWLLGCGFRVLGNLGASVLYTRYTDLNYSYVEGTYADYSEDMSPLGTLRAITESALGLGWGCYFGDNNDYHIDFGASYDFNVHWNQNMGVKGTAPGNVYIHGLNVAARLDF